MIFVTVGSQMPFDRLIGAMDEWATRQADRLDIIAQVGKSSFRPQALRAVASLSPKEFSEQVRAARVIVAHAGMGSVLTALELGKPLVLMPRRGDLQETRNDHQVATARWLSGRKGIFIAMDEAELPGALESAIASAVSSQQISPYAPPPLLDALKDFIGSPVPLA